MPDPTHDDVSRGCPIPISDYPEVQLAHGGGGRLMRQLIERMLVPSFDNPHLRQAHDGAVLAPEGERVAFTTDSFVVHPLQFPGGDIGKLSIYGTVNDLAMCGARPRYLSLGLIAEEGLSMETLWEIVESIRDAAEETGVEIVTGDTKVVDRGKGDGLYVNTSGIGFLAADVEVGPHRIEPGDVVIASGDLGRHGIAIMAVREGLEFETTIESDCAPLAAPIQELLEGNVEIHCLRDLTRGGLASAVVEIATGAGRSIRLEERAIAVDPQVHAACELLGLDPLYVANEGRFIAIVPAAEADRALEILRQHDVSAYAEQIGTVLDDARGLVTMTTEIGASRVIDLLSGEQLPRIC